MNEFSKLLHYTPSEPETDFATDQEDDVSLAQEGITEIDRARIQVMMQQIEVKHFCEDIAEGIQDYREKTRSNPSKQRQLDLNSLEYVISEPKQFSTKEACIIAIKEQLDALKTGWLIFKGKSRLKDIINHIIMMHTSPQLKVARELLRTEMVSNLKLEKRYRFVRGEDIAQLKFDLAAAQEEIAQLKEMRFSQANSTESRGLEVVIQSSSFLDRFSSVFRNK